MSDDLRKKPVVGSDVLSVPRLTIAAVRGGSGKTIVSLGLVRAWRREEKIVVPFKKGPDYIDAGWLGRSAGRPCFNLDPYLMPWPVVEASFFRRTSGADVGVIEGNRGLFDGVDEAGSYSTAELAKRLDCPIVLVLDCTKMTRTAAAVVWGCANFDSSVRIGGVILNQVAHGRQEGIVRAAIESRTGIPVLGVLPRLKEDPLPMRHLGVLPSGEHPEADKVLDDLADLVSRHADLAALKALAESAAPMSAPEGGGPQPNPSCPSHERPRIGIVRDEAFQFYYPENMEALDSAGGDLVFLDSLRDPVVPEIDALYIGGGFPETMAGPLSENMGFRAGILDLIQDGLPVYAECGGLMYLGRHIQWEGKTYSMVGALGLDFVLSRRPVGHGYSILEVREDTPFHSAGCVLRGHEFHYSRPVFLDGFRGSLSCRVARGHGFDGKSDGVTYRNVFGTYTHLHALASPDWAGRIVKAARRYRVGRGMSTKSPSRP